MAFDIYSGNNYYAIFVITLSLFTGAAALELNEASGGIISFAFGGIKLGSPPPFLRRLGILRRVFLRCFLETLRVFRGISLLSSKEKNGMVIYRSFYTGDFAGNFFKATRIHDKC